MSVNDQKENSSNKNMWLAVALAVITSLTSLGTAFISKDKSSSSEDEKRVEILETEFKELKKTNEDLHGLIVITNDKIKDCSCN